LECRRRRRLAVGRLSLLSKRLRLDRRQQSVGKANRHRNTELTALQIVLHSGRNKFQCDCYATTFNKPLALSFGLHVSVVSELEVVFPISTSFSLPSLSSFPHHHQLSRAFRYPGNFSSFYTLSQINCLFDNLLQTLYLCGSTSTMSSSKHTPLSTIFQHI
jgi:hypothetical protein